MVQSRAGEGGTVGLMVRVPESLRDRIKEAAEINGRSMNSEIVLALEDAFPEPTAPTEEVLAAVNRLVALQNAFQANPDRLDLKRAISAARMDLLDLVSADASTRND